MLSLSAVVDGFFDNFPLGTGQWGEPFTCKPELDYYHTNPRFDNHKLGLVPLLDSLDNLASPPTYIFKHTLGAEITLAASKSSPPEAGFYWAIPYLNGCFRCQHSETNRAQP